MSEFTRRAFLLMGGSLFMLGARPPKKPRPNPTCPACVRANSTLTLSQIGACTIATISGGC